MINRTWKDVTGYEGRYQVSSDGLVLSLNRKETSKRGWTRFRKERVLKSHPDKDGYLLVVLCKHAKTQTIHVHKLVALAFIPNTESLPQLNHKDGVKRNNDFQNLEWCNQSHNMRHAYRIGLVDKSKTQGERHWKSCLKKEDIQTIRKEYQSGNITQAELARRFGIRPDHVSRIVSRQLWGSVI